MLRRNALGPVRRANVAARHDRPRASARTAAFLPRTAMTAAMRIPRRGRASPPGPSAARIPPKDAGRAGRHPTQGRIGPMPYSTQQVRNVALAGHPGAGKTTLFEALLHAGGTVQTAGTVERGNTVSDFDPIEKQRGHSIDAAIAGIDYRAAADRSVHINLVDLPGYPEFRGPALSALGAVETAAIVVDATGGVEYGTRRMMERAKERGLCRAIVVSRIDAEGADPGRVLDQLREAFGPEVL